MILFNNLKLIKFIAINNYRLMLYVFLVKCLLHCATIELSQASPRSILFQNPKSFGSTVENKSRENIIRKRLFLYLNFAKSYCKTNASSDTYTMIGTSSYTNVAAIRGMSYSAYSFLRISSRNWVVCLRAHLTVPPVKVKLRLQILSKLGLHFLNIYYLPTFSVVCVSAKRVVIYNVVIITIHTRIT